MSREQDTVKKEQSKTPENADVKGSSAKAYSQKRSDLSGKKSRIQLELFDPLTSRTAADSIELLLNTFKFSPVQQRSMADAFGVMIQAEVKKRSPEGHPVHWSYVPTLPTERSFGRCLSLEFGSSNNYFQIVLCNIAGGESALTGELSQSLTVQQVDKQAFLLMPTLRKAHMDVFGDFVATCVRKVMLDNGLTGSESDPVPMGVVAAFDTRVVPQISPTVAIIFPTFKDYHMKGFFHKDFVATFHSAFKRANIHVQIVTVMNDTVSTLMWGIHKVSSMPAHCNSDCSIGIVSNQGGANMSYLETDQEFLDLCSNDRRLLLRTPKNNGSCAVVNTECGTYVGQNYELLSMAGVVEKQLSDQLGTPIRFECMASGLWYPEQLLCCIKALRTSHVLGQHMQRFENMPRSTCFQLFSICDRWHFKKETAVSLNAEIRNLLDKSVTEVDSITIADVCQSIMGRTGQVMASGVMALANKLYGKLFPSKMVLACDGSMFQFTQLEAAFRESLSFMVPEETEVCLMKSNWAFGCATLAISAAKMQKNFLQ